jgi:thioredoxin
MNKGIINMDSNDGRMVDVTENEFDSFLSDNKVVLVDFWAGWCLPCRMQTKMIKGKIKDMPDGAVVVKVNVDNYPTIAKKYHVRGIPQMFLFVEGKPVKGWTGVTQVSELFGEMSKYT